MYRGGRGAKPLQLCPKGDIAPKFLRPWTPPSRGRKGLALFEPFLGCADSTVQDPGLPIITKQIAGLQSGDVAYIDRKY